MSSSSCCQKTSLRPVVLVLVLLSCVFVLFFTYYKPSISFPLFSRNTECFPPLLCQVKAQNNVTSAPTADLGCNKTRVGSDTVLLIWTWPFGLKFDLDCGVFNVTGCHLTDDRTLYPRAHGVLFHHRDIRRDLEGLPKQPRPCFQKWVWLNMESPANSAPVPGLDQIFNVTCSYRLDSDVPVPYGYLVPLTPSDQRFNLPQKNKLVCWVVSNWKPRYRRVQFYNELKKYVAVSSYGAAFGQQLDDQKYSQIVSSCKFYLSFENSVYRDYITEKLFHPMMLGSVPVVLGPSRQNYQDHIPAQSFIHVDDFSGPKELANRLLYLDRNHTEYMKYFSWRSSSRVQMSWFGKEQACKTCRYLQKNTAKKTVHDLKKWYWG